MRLFVGLSLPLRVLFSKWSLLALILLTVRPLALLSVPSSPVLRSEATVSQAIVRSIGHLSPTTADLLEYAVDQDLHEAGAASIANVRALHGNGWVAIGTVQQSDAQHPISHVWGESLKHERVDLTCPDCPVQAVSAVLFIRDYAVTAKRVLDPQAPDLDRTMRGLKTALMVEKFRARLEARLWQL